MSTERSDLASSEDDLTPHTLSKRFSFLSLKYSEGDNGTNVNVGCDHNQANHKRNVTLSGLEGHSFILIQICHLDRGAVSTKWRDLFAVFNESPCTMQNAPCLYHLNNVIYPVTCSIPRSWRMFST